MSRSKTAKNVKLRKLKNKKKILKKTTFRKRYVKDKKNKNFLNNASKSFQIRNRKRNLIKNRKNSMNIQEKKAKTLKLRTLKIFRTLELLRMQRKLQSFCNKKKVFIKKITKSRILIGKKIKTFIKMKKEGYLLTQRERFQKDPKKRVSVVVKQIRRFLKKRRKAKKLERKLRLIRKRRIRRFKKRKFRFLPKTHPKTKLSLFPVSFYQLILQSPKRIILPPTKKTFKLLKILLLTFKIILRSSFKKQVFYLTMLRQLLMSLFRLPLFMPKMFMLRTLSLLLLKEATFKHSNLHYFRKIVKTRFLIFQGAHSAIISSIKSFDKNKNITVSFFGMDVSNLSAALTCNYIIYKLGQYFSIQVIFKNLLRDLKFAWNLDGFRIVVAGRLTRKERAAYLIRRKGRLDLSKKSSLVDYASDFKIMRFGVVGVKVWFNQRKFRPNYYLFRFNVNNL